MDRTQAEALARAASAMLELSIDPSMLEGVVDNLVLLQLHGARVLAFALPAEEESAGVFRA